MCREDFSIDGVFNTLCSYPGEAPGQTKKYLLRSTDYTEEYISMKSMIRFFKRNGFYANVEDVQAIIRRLDLNYDEVITREELAKFILNAAKICIIPQSKNIPQPLNLIEYKNRPQTADYLSNCTYSSQYGGNNTI